MRLFVIAIIASVAVLAQGASIARAQATKPAASWNNVTHNAGGDKWGYAGVTYMAAVPGTDEIIAGVSEAGLWSTRDRGKIWTKLGGKDATQIQNRPYQIIFDPKDPKTFWESGSYNGPGLFKTSDGGQTFTPLGKVTHLDGIGVDFTDPARKTLLLCHHEQLRSVEKSVDGGQTWQKIGPNVPEPINFTSDLVVFDSKTYLVNAAGWKQENGKQLPFGIYRTADGGATWAKVFDAGPSGPACVTPTAIYWQTLWAAGLVTSGDQGKTWQKLPGPIKTNPIELAGKRLAATVEKQLYISPDAGKTWKPVGAPLPFKPNGIVYSENGRAIYAWRSTEAKEDGVIERLDLEGQ
ncbi:MAG TPA: hypothetical protein VFC78_05400 [Tepidisphaeraceae bacterium]|nr:hypothetical protein [Tepidisphaeraceae bacterium]